MAYRTGISVTAAGFAVSVLALASAAQAASPVSVADTRVFPESISVTSDGTLLIAGSEKGIIYKATPGAAPADAPSAAAPAGAAPAGGRVDSAD